jgi:hypothetical protein
MYQPKKHVPRRRVQRATKRHVQKRAREEARRNAIVANLFRDKVYVAPVVGAKREREMLYTGIDMDKLVQPAKRQRLMTTTEPEQVESVATKENEPTSSSYKRRRLMPKPEHNEQVRYITLIDNKEVVFSLAAYGVEPEQVESVATKENEPCSTSYKRRRLMPTEHNGQVRYITLADNKEVVF